MAGKTFPGRDWKSGCQKYFPPLTNGRGDSPSTVASVLKGRSKSSCWAAQSRTSDCTCNCLFFELSSACSTCRSKLATVPSYREWTANCAPHPERSNHPFREAMKAAGVPKWESRDSNDLSSASQSSHSWTAAQILTPILVGLILCLSFALYLLYKRGRLSRLISNFPFMRRSRRPPLRRWTINDDAPSRGVPHLDLDAEATPILNARMHWPSLSPHDTIDSQRLNPRTRAGVLTPAFSSALRSMQRLFGLGPIPVSRVPVPDAFDLGDPDTETLSDTLRSNSSRSWRNGLSSLGRNPASSMDRALSTQHLPIEVSGSSAALDTMPDYSRGYDEDAADVTRDGGANGHDVAAGVDGNEVMLISRDGEDFNLDGSMISVPLGNGPVKVDGDRRSIEVVPPTPILGKQSFRQSVYHARSASTPHLPNLLSDSSLIRSFSPSTSDLPSLRFKRPLYSPTPMSAPLQQVASSSSSSTKSQSRAPSRERPHANGAHYYTEATPPVDSSGSSTHRRIDMSSTLSLPPSPPTDGYSPPVSPHLYNYAPSFPGRLQPGSVYVPPGSVSSPSPIDASDPQNLIPFAVRGAGYNPFQHARSSSDL